MPPIIEMSIRQRVLALADNRALEEEAERSNPIAPSLRGRGATPSMGLSQFRGGRRQRSLSDIIEHDEETHPSLYLKEADAMAEMPSGEYDGAGAHAQGAALGKHLLGLRGGAYHKAFCSGMSGAGLSGGGVDTGRYEGEGKLEIVHHGGKSHMVGGVKKPKRVVGAGDGRRKRAEIVRKVMAERGCSMIDASRYVKEHNLYHG